MIDYLVLCILWWWDVRNIEFIYTLQSVNVMRLLRRSQYVAASPVLRRTNASSDIPDRIDPAYQVIVFDLSTLATMKILRNIHIRMFRSPCSHSRSLNTSIPSSVYNMPRLFIPVCHSPSWINYPYSIVRESQFLTTL